MVNDPTRPRSIMNMIKPFPASFNSAVMPSDNPTVPNAETVSNRMAVAGMWPFDKMTSVVIIIMNKKLEMATTYAFLI